jgi:hypothetical protein
MIFMSIFWSAFVPFAIVISRVLSDWLIYMFRRLHGLLRFAALPAQSNVATIVSYDPAAIDRQLRGAAPPGRGGATAAHRRQYSGV